LQPLELEILAELVQSFSRNNQVIISTQSPYFVDHLPCADLFHLHHVDGSTTFVPLEDQRLFGWMA
jgi:predicted ATPase